ncbi:polymer-forming cytoskeletal protein [Halococcoides cellulosivorans]|uniref:DUF8173 domain-containing protein n=1 Tax=Halococcoides cellulosivorans TaxID=1679096 RepID=A0A2R4X082_9EURY|nr:polymer-forming cytoskeletal protein [Halococcoides cellulosivorans]AWB27189.1 hypothetical protein HARCEL1_05460 [Halococcoides cellulosivorans]
MTRTGRLLAILALVVLGAAVVPGIAAAEERTGGAVVVGPDETVTDGLVAYGGTVVVEGTVEGDLTAFAGSIVVTESGQVTGDIVANAGDVSIGGTVDGAVTGSAGSVRIRETGSVGSIDTEAGYLQIDGSVTGSVTAAVDRLQIGPDASIGGDLTYDEDATVVGDPGAATEGSATSTDLRSDGAGAGAFSLLGLLAPGYFLLVDLFLGAILLIVLPRFSERVTDHGIDRPHYAAGAGVAALFAVPVFSGILILSVVGIPIALVIAPAVAIVGGWIAFVYGKYTLGRWVLARFDVTDRWLGLLAGMVGVAALGLIPIVGPLVGLIALLVGGGALIFALRDQYHDSEETLSIARRID